MTIAISCRAVGLELGGSAILRGVDLAVDAGWGLSTSMPVSSTKVVVTMKKISRMNTQSMSGEMSIPSDSSSCEKERKRLMIRLLPPRPFSGPA